MFNESFARANQQEPDTWIGQYGGDDRIEKAANVGGEIREYADRLQVDVRPLNPVPVDLSRTCEGDVATDPQQFHVGAGRQPVEKAAIGSMEVKDLSALASTSRAIGLCTAARASCLSGCLFLKR